MFRPTESMPGIPRALRANYDKGTGLDSLVTFATLSPLPSEPRDICALGAGPAEPP